MKNHIKILLLLTVLLAVGGCGKKSGQAPQSAPNAQATTFDSTDIKGSPLGDDESKNVALRYTPAKGSVFNYRFTSLSEEKAIIRTDDTTVTQKTTQTLIYMIQVKIADIEEDGTIDAVLTATAANLNAELNGKKIKYQSGTQIDSVDRDRFMQYEAMINNSFEARIRPNGEISEIYKVDKIIGKIFKVQNVSRDTIPQDRIKMFEDNIKQSMLVPILQQIFRELSAKPVSKNETWSVNRPTINLQIVAFENRVVNKLAQVEKLGGDKMAAIDVSLLTKPMVNPEIKKNNISITNCNLGGEGKLYFNLSKGMFQKNKTSMVISLGMKGKVPTAKGLQQITSDKITTTSFILELLNSN